MAQDNQSISTIDKAHKIFNEIQSIDAQAPGLKKGLAQVVNAYSDLAEQALANKEYDDAQTLVEKGLAIDANNSLLLKIRDSINQVKVKDTKVFGGF